MKDLLSHLDWTFHPEAPLLFTQFGFWVFFAIVYAGFALLNKRLVLRNLFLFASSAFFYYKTSGWCLLILLSCIVSDYFIAHRIHRCQQPLRRKAWLLLSVCLNLLLLCFFKYSYFFIDLTNTLLGTDFRVFNVFAFAGNQLMGQSVFRVDYIVLPVGISFYLFQTLSHTVDVYRRRMAPVKSLLDYGFYVSFFPQLVAGPIVRASVFVPQIYRPFRLSKRQFGLAVFWIVNGLLKKIVLSDYLAVNFIDRVFANPLMYSGFENLSALFLYSLQVYADFSGYTDIAIGVAMLMGFHLPKNFHSPYKATNAGNFWKRWHISLSKWLQDYLYIPMGGSRQATFGSYFWVIVIMLVAVMLSRSLWVLVACFFVFGVGFVRSINRPDRRLAFTTKLNLMNTMLIGGLWHGASLNFVIWGGLNGLGVLLYKSWKSWSPLTRLLLPVGMFFLTFAFDQWVYPSPLLNIAQVWTGLLAIGSVVRYLYGKLKDLCVNLPSCLNRFERAMDTIWGVLQTFVFISFTRLFFRSGSNLDPAEANRVAWETARNMIVQMGSPWPVENIPSMLWEYRCVFLLFVLGMVIHWLPDRFKRRYRLCFASLPLGWMALAVVLSVLLMYQFVSADLQSFIYFQF